MRRLALFILAVAIALPLSAQTKRHFLPLDQWRIALAAGNMKRFAQFYSSKPPVEIQTGAGKTKGPDTELEFWNDIRKSGLHNLRAEIFSTKNTSAGKVTSVHMQYKTDTPNGLRTRYVLYTLLWQRQGQAWRIIKLTRSGVLKMVQPSKLNPALYKPNANARKEIQEAVEKSEKDHKRILLMFGGNWCYDCHVLDYAFHQPDLEPIVQKNFRVIHVDIGAEVRKNADLIAKYHIPVEKGVPALAVLDSNGDLLYSQQDGQFESARSLDPDDVIAFLNKWKPEQ